MIVPRLAVAEERLVERYVSVLDLVSRCARAVDQGNTHYLWDKAGQLERAAESLKDELGRAKGIPRVRSEAVLAAVRYHARHYRAGRLLHPSRVPPTPEEVGSILLDVAGVVGLRTEVDLLAILAGDAHAIAERTDLAPLEVVRVLCALRRWEVRDAG